jgi:AraC-like DNA-binding protein
MRFNAFDHFADTVRGWDLDFHQLDRGSFRAELRQVETDAALVIHALFNRKLEQGGGAPPGRWTFGILEPSSPEIVLRGQIVSDQMMMIYPPGSDLDAATPPGFRVLTVSVPITVVEEWNDWNQMDGGRGLRLMSGVTRIESSKLETIRHAANRLVTAAEADNSLIHELSRNVQSNILEALPRAVFKKPKPSAEKMSRILNILRDYIEAHLSEHITLMDLCALAKVSPRTIQRSFKGRFGTTPKAYIQARRLNYVRRDLSNEKNYGIMVADIANRWGFWHMGQFASDYRRLFGELPSETLNRANK